MNFRFWTCFLRTVFEHVAKLAIRNAILVNAIKLDEFLHFRSRQLRLLADRVGDAGDELVGGDDATAERIEVAEKVERADAVLEDGDADAVKDRLQIRVRLWLQK